jgi:hypothetical protein
VVEQRIEDPCVPGSTPGRATIISFGVIGNTLAFGAEILSSSLRGKTKLILKVSKMSKPEEKSFQYKFNFHETVYFIHLDKLHEGIITERSSNEKLDKEKSVTVHESYVITLKNNTKVFKTNNVNDLYRTTHKCVEDLIIKIK